MIHEQVKIQLEHLKLLVDIEEKREKDCKEWKIPYIPSRRKWEDIRNYEEYKKEIEQNGDKNLLVMVKMKGDFCMYGTYPFARRYVDRKFGEYFLKHHTKNGADILLTESEVEVVK